MSGTRHRHRFDIVALGEVLVEFTRAEGECWRGAWAGDALNSLFYAARLGLKTGLITRFGTDPFTSQIHDGIEDEGINLELVSVDRERGNGLYFVETDNTGEYRFHFLRSQSAARETLLLIDRDRLTSYLSESGWFLTSSISLAVMHESDQLPDLLQNAKEKSGVSVAFDTNYRAALWQSPEFCRERIEGILPQVDLFLPSASDLAALWPDEFDPAQPASFLEEIAARYNLDHILLKRAEAGALLFYNGTFYSASVPSSINVVDTTGAGDGLNGGYIAGLVSGLSPEDAMRLGMSVAAEVVGCRGAIDREFRGA